MKESIKTVSSATREGITIMAVVLAAVVIASRSTLGAVSVVVAFVIAGLVWQKRQIAATQDDVLDEELFGDSEALDLDQIVDFLGEEVGKRAVITLSSRGEHSWQSLHVGQLIDSVDSSGEVIFGVGAQGDDVPTSQFVLLPDAKGFKALQQDDQILRIIQEDLVIEIGVGVAE